MNSAKNTKLKKLMIETASSEARTTGECLMNLAPAVSEPLPGSAAGGSFGWIRARKHAEPRNEAASASTASGAVRNWTSAPPTLGPPTNENARLP